jgi:hypothetical protein
MNASRLKFQLGLLGAFLAAIGYCAWPYFAAPDRPIAATPELPRVEVSWLNPELEPPAVRDPFERPGAAMPQPTKPSGPSSASTAGAPAAASAPAPAPPELTLGAVLIRGERRSAILNGRVYRSGEPLRVEGQPAGAWRLEKVGPEGVLVTDSRGRRPIQIGFPRREVATSPKSRSDAPAPASEALSIEKLVGGSSGILERLGQRSGGDLGTAYRDLLGLFAGAMAGEGRAIGPKP